MTAPCQQGWLTSELKGDLGECLSVTVVANRPERVN